MDTILALPGLIVTTAMTLAGMAAFLGSHNGPPPNASGILTPAAELQLLLSKADQVYRKGTPYGSLATARLLAR